jgi:hypothetical protein
MGKHNDLFLSRGHAAERVGKIKKADPGKSFLPSAAELGTMRTDGGLCRSLSRGRSITVSSPGSTAPFLRIILIENESHKHKIAAAYQLVKRVPRVLTVGRFVACRTGTVRRASSLHANKRGESALRKICM